jgi:hypothetical protein
MPLTLPTHPLAVVPLKMWRPRWFDGVALTLGAIAPDVAYAAEGYGLTIDSHAWHAPLWWALPLTLLGAPVVRWAAAPVAAHLPAAGPLRLRDYGVLATVRHPWRVTAWSAVLGALSHLLWDAVTHPAITGGRIPLPPLAAQTPVGLPWWYLISMVSDLVGFVAGAALAVHIGRSGLLRRWHGAPPDVARRPVRFWAATCTVLAAGFALVAVLPGELFHVTGVRSMLVVGLALLAGAVAIRVPSRPGSGRPAWPRTARHRRPGAGLRASRVRIPAPPPRR